MSIINKIKEIIDRLKAKTPLFFRWLQAVSASISAIAITSQNTIGQYLPDNINVILHYAAISGIVSIIVSQFAKEDTIQKDTQVQP